MRTDCKSFSLARKRHIYIEASLGWLTTAVTMCLEISGRNNIGNAGTLYLKGDVILHSFLWWRDPHQTLFLKTYFTMLDTFSTHFLLPSRLFPSLSNHSFVCLSTLSCKTGRTGGPATDSWESRLKGKKQSMGNHVRWILRSAKLASKEVDGFNSWI